MARGRWQGPVARTVEREVVVLLEVEAFVHGTPLQVPYNSRLPIVIYIPEGFEVTASYEEYSFEAR